jgi:protein-tyrosine-phosphatase
MFRSQVAEALYNKFKKDDSIAVSYGTYVEKEGFEGRTIASLIPIFSGINFVVSYLKKYNLDISNSTCTQIMKEHLENVDKIIVMTEREFIPEWLNKFNYEYWEGVPNPKSIDEELAEIIIELIKGKVLKLIEK